MTGRNARYSLVAPGGARSGSVPGLRVRSKKSYAVRRPTTTTHHGIDLTDDYAWLRDPGYPEVNDQAILAHLEAENKWFEAWKETQQPLIETVYRELRGRIKEADASVPVKDGDWPRKVSMPAAAPGGCRTPDGNGFVTLFAGVRPPSSVETNGVAMLKPLV